MKITLETVILHFFVLVFGAGSALAADLAGQSATCGNGPKHRVLNLTGQEKVVELGEGVKTKAWTFNGTTPGPTLEVCEGDTVKVVLENEGAIAHGLDSHAFRINAAKFGPVGPGETMTFEKKVDTPGVFMYHCANGDVTDQHIKMGMFGVMIVYPRKELRPAHEFVVAENGVYGEPDPEGMIAPTTERMDENRAYLVLYNGKINQDPVKVEAGELVRVYFVNAGPFASAFHVIGAIVDRAYESGNPRNVAYDVQTSSVPAGSGGMFEFRIPEKGKYLLVDHDKLSQLPNGLVIPIVAHQAMSAKEGSGGS